jgi:hypothetical protein
LAVLALVVVVMVVVVMVDDMGRGTAGLVALVVSPWIAGSAA